MSSTPQYRVVAGPYRIALRYAQSMGWRDDEYVIVTRGHQLAGLDPARIMAIITVKLNTMAARVVAEIHDELQTLRALWPVTVLTAS